LANSAEHPGVVLITGATGAIGRALALAYAAPGRSLVLHGRNEERLRQTAQSCERLGATIETKALDVRELSALTAWVDDVASRRGVGLAIVNAGAINVLRPDAKQEAWQDAERVMSVNVAAAIATVAALLPHMRRRGSGQIALMSSLLAWFGMPVAPAYSASKAALKTYGEALRGPLAREGIRINVVLPGFVKSDMSDELRVPKPFMLSAEDAAGRIKRGLEANRARISFPLPLSVGCRILSALPPAAAQRLLALLGFARR
jgi:short-subunit dehydrogenase